MLTSKINTLQTPVLSMQDTNKQKVSVAEAQSNFSNSLKGAIEQLNNVQMESDKKTQALASGQIDNLHDVMITAQKASVTLQTAVEIQRKAIDAYNEIMRMQV